MKIIYKNKELNLQECKSFFSRLKGFMLCKNINKGLLFNNCNSIHTFFMYKNIDVIMCNKNNTILYYYKNLGKNKIILPKKGVYKVFEVPVQYFEINLYEKLEVKE